MLNCRHERVARLFSGTKPFFLAKDQLSQRFSNAAERLFDNSNSSDSIQLKLLFIFCLSSTGGIRRLAAACGPKHHVREVQGHDKCKSSTSWPRRSSLDHTVRYQQALKRMHTCHHEIYPETLSFCCAAPLSGARKRRLDPDVGLPRQRQRTVNRMKLTYRGPSKCHA